MDSMKILEMHLSLQMDDLKDAEMLSDYAEQAKEAGEEALAQKLTAKAKTRLQSFENCEAEITNYLVRLKTEESEEDVEKIIHQAYKDYFEEEKDKIKTKVMSM